MVSLPLVLLFTIFNAAFQAIVTKKTKKKKSNSRKCNVRLDAIKAVVK
jgi:hypothetical protein